VIDESIYKVDKESFYNPNLKDKIVLIDNEDKKESILNLLKAYFSDAKAILYDSSNQLIKKRVKNFNLSFDNFSTLFFTSGTTGEPVGAFKSRDNLDLEAKVLANLIKKYNIKKAIITVPFIHIYGTLVGLLLPIKLQIDIIIKRHFLPQELIKLITPNTLIITTPLYLKSLNRLDKNLNFSSPLFISSTALLQESERDKFLKKYNTNLLQLFGSTETGGVGYKFDKENEWNLLKNVEIRVDKNSLLEVKSPYISKNILKNSKIIKTKEYFQTFDFVKLKQKKFKLIGRDSQIIKVAGKRYSIIQIENILEKLPNIKKALIKIKKDNTSLKDEVLEIFLETTTKITKKEIKKTLSQNLTSHNLSFELKIVDKISLSAMGKKINLK